MKKKIIIAIVVVLIVVGGGGYYVLSEQSGDALTSPLQPSPSPLAATPTESVIQGDTKHIKEIAEQFYLAYTECLTTPPAEAKGKVSVYCQQNTGFTTEAFPQNLKEAGTARYGADPITCAQNPPSSVSIGEVDYEDPMHAIATAIALFGGSAQKIPVQLSKEGSVWKVDAVICPRM